ncbi:uncharacterized protein [Miscanthus floridulus]|uniref:uncharacterized protein isoform X2 n=1 Tax=Miscanthus floridulus TaxID=154761 RepID=UPI00345A7EA0
MRDEEEEALTVRIRGSVTMATSEMKNMARLLGQPEESEMKKATTPRARRAVRRGRDEGGDGAAPQAGLHTRQGRNSTNQNTVVVWERGFKDGERLSVTGHSKHGYREGDHIHVQYSRVCLGCVDST